MSLYTTLKNKLHAAALAGAAPKLGEDVVYTPGTGDPRTVRAIVSRDPVDQMGNVQVGKVTLRFTNDTTLGITPDEVDTGSDTITVAMTEGSTPTVRAIRQIESQSAVQLTLEVN